ncbi:hypothetical protein HKD37_15G043363 [Glycine soja]
MYPPLFFLNLVDVPSTRTDPQEMEREESKEFSDCVVLNPLTREKGDTKEFRRLVLCSFGKGRRETQKEFRRLVLGEFFLAKGEENEKMNSTSFQGLGSSSSMDSFASWKMNGNGMEREGREEMPLQGEDESRRSSAP